MHFWILPITNELRIFVVGSSAGPEGCNLHRNKANIFLWIHLQAVCLA